MTDFAFTSAAELAAMIRNRDVSPVEVMAATLARIEKSQPALNAFITIAAETAMGAAREAETAVMQGAPLGPLHGVPVAVKDLVPTAGIRTTWGSLIFKDHVPDEDAAAVARLKQAGAIVVGKTTTPEFGQQCLTEAPLFGRTRNPWRADRTSGGSSGGSAVAVAAGLVPIAMATDGGGSTRIPAACNGVVGFKQGLGLVPQEYAQDGFGNISYITPMTRTVRDTALMLEVMTGPDGRDPLTVGRERPDFVAAAQSEGSLAGLRIGWRPRLGNGAVAREVLAACEAALQALSGLGAEVAELTAPFENPERIWFTVNGAYRRAQFGHHLERHRAVMCPTFVRQMDLIAAVPPPNCTTPSFSAPASTGRCNPGSPPATSSRCRPCRAPRCRSIRTSSARSRSTANGCRTSAPPGIPIRCRST